MLGGLRRYLETWNTLWSSEATKCALGPVQWGTRAAATGSVCKKNVLECS